MSHLYILFEHASGYALFQVAEFEEIAMLLPQVEQSIHNLAKFRTVVNMVAFQPFKTGKDALENINHLSEGLIHVHLQLFLESNVPKKKKKKQPVLLGVSDPKLAASITEMLGIPTDHTGVVPEIERGIRLHFHNLVSGLDEEAASKAQLGLSHNYSRAKVKFNVNRVDNMIIQSIALLDQLDKDINTFAMRVREWYSYHFPELFQVVPDNATYSKVVSLIKNREAMDEDIAEKLEEVLMDSTKVQHVLEIARTSMGMEISPMDLTNIEMFAQRVVSLTTYRSELMNYLKSRMHDIAPNLAALIGETVGARLISHAGSLTNLAKYPASTVQILGAEKALFRALKSRGNTPKYGLIFHSTFIGKAAKENKGRISRFLANKCSIASRIDCFADIPTEIFGQTLKQQVEDRLKYFETGDIPNKNIDVMSAATDQACVMQEGVLKEQKKREKKELKKRKRELLALATSMAEESQNSEIAEELGVMNGIPPKIKKRKAKLVEDVPQIEDPQQTEVDDLVPKKKKVKLQHSDESYIKSPKKKKHLNAAENSVESADIPNDVFPKKKKKSKSLGVEQEEVTSMPVEESVTKKKKKKKRALAAE